MSASDGTGLTIPASPDEITAEWLTEALPGDAFEGQAALSVSVEDIGEGTGIFGQLARMEIGTGDGSAWFVIAKLPCTEPANLAVANALGIYERELNMYEHVIPHASFRAPGCYTSLRDDQGAFVMLLEDLSTDYDVGDQVVGATLDQAEAIIDVLATFHAQWWEKPELQTFDWLPVPNTEVYRTTVPDIYKAGLPVLQADWTDRVSAESIELATALEPRFVEILDRTAGGPETIIHGDTRLDNIFFAKDGSGEIAFIDFQLALRGRGVADLAYLLGTSMDAGLSAQHWERLLARWHARLVDHGVSDYSFDQAKEHYLTAALYYVVGAMSLIGSFDTGNERGAAMAEAYSTRILAHVVDIDAGSVL